MSIAHPNIVNWMQGGMQGPRPTYQGGMSGGGVGWGQTGASPSWPGANPNPPMSGGSGGSGNYNMGPSFNPQSMLERMKQGMINRRPQPNQNPYSNPTPGQNPMMGGVGRASGINFGPGTPPGMQNPMSQTNMPVNAPGPAQSPRTGPGYDASGITGGMNFGPGFDPRQFMGPSPTDEYGKTHPDQQSIPRQARPGMMTTADMVKNPYYTGG